MMYNYNQQQLQQLRKQKQLLMEQSIKKASARVLWSQSTGVDSVQYSEMFGILRAEFHEQTHSTRSIEPNDWVEAFKKFGKMSTSDYKISIQYFNNIYEWFLGIVQLIKVLYEEWNEQKPCAIAGFISRETAINRLKSMPQGTFIIRFSTSALQSIAISYRDANTVEHIKGSLLPQSAKFLFAIKNHQQNQCEMSLASFVQKFKKISLLYDFVNNQTQPKVDVYFGRGKQDAVAMMGSSNHNVADDGGGSSQHSNGNNGIMVLRKQVLNANNSNRSGQSSHSSGSNHNNNNNNNNQAINVQQQNYPSHYSYM